MEERDGGVQMVAWVSKCAFLVCFSPLARLSPNLPPSLCCPLSPLLAPTTNQNQVFHPDTTPFLKICRRRERKKDQIINACLPYVDDSSAEHEDL